MYLNYTSNLSKENRISLDEYILENRLRVKKFVGATTINILILFLVPAFNIKKKKNKWIVSVALAKELYLYSYPFQFSTYFTTNYQFQVKLQIIQATSVQSLKKQFYVQDFLSQFNVSHAKQTQIKKVIIQTLDELKNNHVIQTQIEIHKTDDSLIKTNILTTRLLTKTKIIYFYEIIQYQNLMV